MRTLEPKDFEQIPMSKVNHKPKKVEVGERPVTNVNVNWLDALRLLAGKKIENLSFAQFSESIGKPVAIGGAAIGGGFLTSINWTLLLTGNVFEIIKLVIGVGSLLVGWFWKK